jgi:hypothetical protein
MAVNHRMINEFKIACKTAVVACCEELLLHLLEGTEERGNHRKIGLFTQI